MRDIVTLSKPERLMLANQYLILEKLAGKDKSEGEFYAARRRALEAGYTFEYGAAFQHLDPEMPPEDCEFVYDVLDMYRAFANANRELKKTERLRARDLQFQGFDGNNESRFYCYAQYVMKDLGKYAESKPVNSHAPRAHVYRAMLERWQQSADKQQLTRADIDRILGAEE